MIVAGCPSVDQDAPERVIWVPASVGLREILPLGAVPPRSSRSRKARGPTPAARWPEVTTDVAVGQMRAIEFEATEPGDWAFHCHKSHHTMNAMGHDISNFIGVDKKDVAKKIRQLVPDYMPMGSAGMADMGAMEMPLPDNTLPMMTGFGQYGPMEMGGMFTVVKVREGVAANDYKDPGWFKHPAGTVAYEWKGERNAAIRAPSPAAEPGKTAQLRVTRRKSSIGGHSNH